MIGIWDIHNHMLPGIDDGASCMEETIDLVKESYSQGVRAILFTPHYRKGMFEISPEERQDIFREFLHIYRESLEKECPGMCFLLGCEFYMHPAKETKKLEKGIYRMPGKNTILTEFSYQDSCSEIKYSLFALIKAGYTVILAHAERYRFSLSEIQELRRMPNLYIQVNAGSLTGAEGFHKKFLTRKLLKYGCVDLIGSDAHDIRKRRMNLKSCADWISEKYGETTARTILISNPEKIFLQKDFL